jgi:hypothetical protein
MSLRVEDLEDKELKAWRPDGSEGRKSFQATKGLKDGRV